MLQMPSSILNLVSFSKGLVGLFGGVCIGTQVVFSIVASGLSNPKTSVTVFIATRTTAILPSPTKCVPLSGFYPFPFAYVAALGFAPFVFAALFCIIHAKAPSSPISSQPDPSPPSDMGASCSAERDPQPSRWWWIIGLILVLLGVALVGFYIYFAYDDVYFTYDNMHSTVHSTLHNVASFCSRAVRMILEDPYTWSRLLFTFNSDQQRLLPLTNFHNDEASNQRFLFGESSALFAHSHLLPRRSDDYASVFKDQLDSLDLVLFLHAI
ncbi:hypothetical protein C8R43DRAFT_944161 [Mycena crocata]|nr:hypothetical protein C8R43DRAFT_944161 [Mycena crocata]